MDDLQRPIDLVAAAERLPSERRDALNQLLNGGLFLSHTSVDAPFIRLHIEPVAVAEFYGAFFFQNRSFPMSEAYEPHVGQALLSCRVFLITLSAAAVHSRYMKAEISVSVARHMPTVVCQLDRTDPIELSPNLRRQLIPLRRQPLAFVDFSADPAQAAKRLRNTLARRHFRCTHSIIS